MFWSIVQARDLRNSRYGRVPPRSLIEAGEYYNIRRVRSLEEYPAGQGAWPLTFLIYFIMAYDLSKLTTKAMCDRAIALAEQERDEQLFDLALVTRHGKAATTGATTTDASLDAVTAEATALAASIGTMTAGPLRQKYERKLRRLTERQTQLTDRLTDFDGVELTDNEFDKRRLNAGLAETATYLTELAAHKDTLTA